jgi:hypothetical protein
MQQVYQSTYRVRIWRLVPVRIDFGAGRRTAAYAEVAQLRNQPRTELMRKLLIVSAILQFAISAAAAQSQIAASKVLSFEQEIRISQLIAKQTEPLSGGSFSIALDALVPAEVQVHSLPPEAEQLAPQIAVSPTSSSKNKLHSLIRRLARSRSYFRDGGSNK